MLPIVLLCNMPMLYHAISWYGNRNSRAQGLQDWSFLVLHNHIVYLRFWVLTFDPYGNSNKTTKLSSPAMLGYLHILTVMLTIIPVMSQWGRDQLKKSWNIEKLNKAISSYRFIKSWNMKIHSSIIVLYSSYMLWCSSPKMANLQLS